jgi:hypothetical protein
MYAVIQSILQAAVLICVTPVEERRPQDKLAAWCCSLKSCSDHMIHRRHAFYLVSQDEFNVLLHYAFMTMYSAKISGDRMIGLTEDHKIQATHASLSMTVF